MALEKTVPAITPIKPPLLDRLTRHAYTDQPRQLTTQASFANAERGHKLCFLGSNAVISLTLLPTLNCYRLTAQMDKRFVLVQTLNVTLPCLLRRLGDDVFDVGGVRKHEGGEKHSRESLPCRPL
jgi:hypothetical protein